MLSTLHGKVFQRRATAANLPRDIKVLDFNYVCKCMYVCMYEHVYKFTSVSVNDPHVYLRVYHSHINTFIYMEFVLCTYVCMYVCMINKYD
jgi:hypothetical protein